MDRQGRITEFNRAAERTFGYTRAAVLGRPLAELIVPPALRERHRQGLARYLATGERRVLDRRIEITAMRADGGEFPVELAVTVVDIGGVPTFTGYLRDITERRRVEDERARLLAGERAARAQAEAARHRADLLAQAGAVLASSLDYATALTTVARLAVGTLADWCMITVIDPDGTARRVGAHANPSREPLVQDVCRLPPDPDLAERLGRVCAGGAFVSSDFSEARLQEVAPDPRVRDALRVLGTEACMFVPLRARDNLLGALSLFSAESGRRYEREDLVFAEELARAAAVAMDNARLYREAQEANRVKDEFLTTLSHELRTPLAAILGWVRLLRDGKAKDPPHALEIIERSGQAQLQLISDLLDVSRIMSGKLRLDLRPLDPLRPVQAAVETIRPVAEAKDIHLECALDPDAEPILADPDRLQQLVWNLLSNAVKFTPSGGWVEVCLERTGAGIRVVVRDSGEGISAEFLPHVFDRFRQADSTTARRHGGLGLGLAIVRSLAELHGGTAEAASPGAGHGATFTVSLPRLGRAATNDAVADAAAGIARLDGVRVLVVDDEPDVCEFLRTRLEERGARVTTVTSSAAALRALEERAPDVLVSDIAMPEEDGYALIRTVRTRGGPLARIPAIAVTAYSGTEDRQRAFLAGYQHHLAKPVVEGELVAAIARFARGRPPGAP
jgi:PAS domain S-box-containing protein